MNKENKEPNKSDAEEQKSDDSRSPGVDRGSPGVDRDLGNSEKAPKKKNTEEPNQKS